MSSGFFTAAELIETLSAPFFSKIATSSIELIPPPTVNGISIVAATLRTKFARVFRFCSVAEISKKTNEELVNIFVPTTPNPTSGFLLMIPKDDLIYLDMTFEEASKFIVSAGTSTPKY